MRTWESVSQAVGFFSSLVHRWEDVNFYGSSFISDPYGRVLVQAPRDAPAVLVADLDLDQSRDWRNFGLLGTRRPEVYAALVAPPAPDAGS